jgi:release factor glutamine methyltransferase
LLKDGAAVLKRAGIKNIHTDTQLILAAALKKDRLYVLTNPQAEASHAETNVFIENIKKRAQGCPLEYITFCAEFYSLPFYVDENVLIPRLDTEVLADAAVKKIGSSGAKVIEIGTGSGVIAVTVAKNCENAEITATDISCAALEIAKKNAAQNNVRVTFRQGDIYAALNDCDYPADYIISNPPYIKRAEIAELDKSVRCFEPEIALNGGADGLNFYRKIITGAKKYLKPSGFVMFEIGYNQALDVSEIFTNEGFADILIKNDSANLNRVIEARKNYV